MTRAPTKPGKPITALALERSALFRLSRSALSERQLRDALKRKCARQARAVDDEVRAWIDAVVDKMRRLGFIDDERTAAARARSLRAAGSSARKALGALRAKGIDPAVAARALADVDVELEGGDAELAAAREYVRRKKLADKDPRKALAALARRGFSYDVASRALAAGR